MKERPMLFSAPMVRAILDGRKTVTRRVLKQATGPSLSVGMSDDDAGVAELSWLWGDGPGYDVNETIKRVACPYGVRGDRLWVRETHYLHGIWSVRKDADAKRRWTFHATQDMGVQFEQPNGLIRGRSTTVPGWYRRPSIHMPRWASRITLEVTGGRVERLQEISEADAKAEGADCLTWSGIEGTAADLIDWPLKEVAHPHRNGFAVLWESINGPESWNANPFVWVVTFRRIDHA